MSVCQTAWPCLLLEYYKDKVWCFISYAVLYLTVYVVVLGGNDQLHQSDLHPELYRRTGKSVNTSQSQFVILQSCIYTTAPWAPADMDFLPFLTEFNLNGDG